VVFVFARSKQVFLVCCCPLCVPWSLSSGAATAGLVLGLGSFTTGSCFSQFCIGTSSLFTVESSVLRSKPSIFLCELGAAIWFSRSSASARGSFLCFVSSVHAEILRFVPRFLFMYLWLTPLVSSISSTADCRSVSPCVKSSIGSLSLREQLGFFRGDCSAP
jgi:hypothetical protein